MFLGSELLAISIILGVCGIQVESLYETVSMVVPNTVIVVTKDLNEKVGIPSIPQFSRPKIAICDPSPTKIPETMSLSVEILLRYVSSS